MPTSELDALINYWNATLFHDAYLISPEVRYLVKETVRQLEFLKTLHPDGRHAPSISLREDN